MRHRRLRGKLGVKSKHRKALLRNLVRSLVIYKRIRTTIRKAKVVSAYADGLVELAKRGDLHARRTLISRLGCPDTVNALITQIAPHFKERRGGYTRVLRADVRPGDAGQMALLEFTETIQSPEKPKKPKKEKKAAAEPAQVEKSKKTAKKEKIKDIEATAEERKESSEAQGEKTEKKKGFLGALRRFLKGDEESH